MMACRLFLMSLLSSPLTLLCVRVQLDEASAALRAELEVADRSRRSQAEAQKQALALEASLREAQGKCSRLEQGELELEKRLRGLQAELEAERRERSLGAQSATELQGGFRPPGGGCCSSI